jgi:pimeloyl-ACP methyl ester carboxylesterase
MGVIDKKSEDESLVKILKFNFLKLKTLCFSFWNRTTHKTHNGNHRTDRSISITITSFLSLSLTYIHTSLHLVWGLCLYLMSAFRYSASLVRRPRTSFITATLIIPRGLFSTSRNSMAAAAKNAATATLSFETTHLGKHGTALLDGLDIYSVPAEDDGHPLAVYGIQSQEPVQYQERDDDDDDDDPDADSNKSSSLWPILLLHGRTWSSVPVYHLLGGPKLKAQEGEEFESRSMMESLLAKGLQPYAMDFRGFGGTHADRSGCISPTRCVNDTASVLKWILNRHGMTGSKSTAEQTTLLGWSQGALVAQLLAQKASSHHLFGKLVLYGSIYDPQFRYPREPLYQQKLENSQGGKERAPIQNIFNDAIEDFTVEGTIPPKPARMFAEAALICDPIKAVWTQQYQFNNCDPGRIHVPTLVVAGDQDPYAPVRVQKDLFVGLGRSDRSWSILADCDHAIHMLEGRKRLNKIIVSFVQSCKKTEML